MARTSAGDAYVTAPSAGEHIWAELLVRIYPHGERATIAVHKRARRGLAVEWDRRLGNVEFSWWPAARAASNRALVEAAAYALLDVASRMPEHPGVADAAGNPPPAASAPPGGPRGE